MTRGQLPRKPQLDRRRNTAVRFIYRAGSSESDGSVPSVSLVSSELRGLRSRNEKTEIIRDAYLSKISSAHHDRRLNSLLISERPFHIDSRCNPMTWATLTPLPKIPNPAVGLPLNKRKLPIRIHIWTASTFGEPMIRQNLCSTCVTRFSESRRSGDSSWLVDAPDAE